MQKKKATKLRQLYVTCDPELGDRLDAKAKELRLYTSQLLLMIIERFEQIDLNFNLKK